MNKPPAQSKHAGRTGRGNTYVAFGVGAHLAQLQRRVAEQLAAEPDCSVLAFCGNYGDVDTGVLEELLALKDRNLARVALHFIMAREPEEGELLSGVLNAARLRLLAKELLAPHEIEAYLLVGAAPDVAPLEAELARLGVAPRKIRMQAGHAAAAAAPVSGGAADQEGMTQVEVVRDGRRSSFSMRTGSESILDAAARAGLDLPFSCRAGVCSTCRTKLVRGEVELAQNYALEDWELAQGFILACQAHAKTGELEITYDET
jgi:ring-1,2-phenylacetyl-CoA epoxidase subunit PaaE